MTAWHDQPQLSRRQLREKSPTDIDDNAVVGERAAGENPPRRSAGRRVQWDPSAEAPAPETPAPETAPDEDVSAGADEAGHENSDEASHENAAGYRVRDYRPDIRRATFAPLTRSTPEDSWSPPADASRTIGAAERAAPPTEIAAPEFTMTRRALRELRQRAEAAGQESPNLMRDASGALALTGSIAVIDVPRDDEEAHVSADAEHDAGDDESVEDPSADELSADELSADELSAVEQNTDAPQHEHIPVDVIVAEQALASVIIDDVTISEATIIEAEIIEVETIEVDGAAATDAADQRVEPDDFDGDTVISAPTQIEVPLGGPLEGQPQAGPRPERLSPFDALFLPPSPVVPVDDGPLLFEHDGGRGVEPAPDAAPYGHWSTQAALDDASQSSEATLSRNVGHTTGAITTHALVLPSAPSSIDHLLNPVTATGEIMVTGSVDLPRSFGSTGAHPALFDHPDVDALIEESDREDAASESAPVRAIRAVSSTSSTRGVIEAPAPRKSRLPLIAGITGGSALLVAAGVVAAGFIFNVF
ncbi:hypothetical protein [Marisediminicola antarctica]|uniref:Uncharacterized protein n=1 Tax=Marisediminicola antarctica TaxID=674079 RepID=A0A7L5AI69_9MICO|nr:hypothetical protein [Marisediminicola antarctica]QHO69766.1 hypothetical protein BHD05_09040 [Marisediminicola antarctica]